jgi:hypothetical protein
MNVNTQHQQHPNTPGLTPASSQLWLERARQWAALLLSVVSTCFTALGIAALTTIWVVKKAMAEAPAGSVGHQLSLALASDGPLSRFFWTLATAAAAGILMFRGGSSGLVAGATRVPRDGVSSRTWISRLGPVEAETEQGRAVVPKTDEPTDRGEGPHT